MKCVHIMYYIQIHSKYNEEKVSPIFLYDCYHDRKTFQGFYLLYITIKLQLISIKGTRYKISKSSEHIECVKVK